MNVDQFLHKFGVNMKKSGVFLFASALLVAAVPATADIVEGRTTNDRPFVTGGIGLGEVDQLKQIADKYSLQLIVSSRSGAYLADMQVAIAAANGQKILDTQLKAPWLLVDLTPGAYTVSVAHPGAPTQQRKVLIAAGKRERIVIQLDVPADTAKNPAPAK